MKKLTLILYGFIVPSMWTAVLLLTFIDPGYQHFDWFLSITYIWFSFICYFLPYFVITNYYKKQDD